VNVLQVVGIVAGSLAVLAGAVFGLLWFEVRRDRRSRERDQTEARLRDMFQAEAPSVRRLVHDKTVAEILAEDSEASDQLRRDLEWATEEYLTAEWLAIRRRFQQDVRFRFMVWARIRLCRFTRQT
jgi:flagellar biosynthesis/type III secretory pathway M-ring protein FliF/YscJ